MTPYSLQRLHFAPMLRIDHTSPVPLRAQVEQLLRELALKPDYQKGALLPDEVALAAQLGVSRGTEIGRAHV